MNSNLLRYSLISCSLLFIIGLMDGAWGTPQSSPSELKRRKQELKVVRKAIDRLQQKIQTLQRQEKQLLIKLNLYQKQQHYVGKYLELLKAEIGRLQWEIGTTIVRFEFLQRRLDTLRRTFQGFVQQLYRQRPMTAEEFLLLPEQLRSEGVQTKYAQQLLGLANQRAEQIVRLQDSLDCVMDTLQHQLNQWSQIYHEQYVQQQQYQRLVAEIQHVLRQVRANRNRTAKQLQQRRQSMRMLQSIIAKLEREAEKVVSGRKQSRSINLRNFQWPVQSRKIIQPYGSYRNPETGIVMDNVGIGIAVPAGSPVYAAAGGVVSLVHWLPGYGTVVILDHGGGIRTVYANLEKAHVVEGQVVRKGEEIGKSGESVDGAYVHFELWKGTKSVDPTTVLR